MIRISLGSLVFLIESVAILKLVFVGHFKEFLKAYGKLTLIKKVRIE
jgi:hypothetical protein